MIEEWCKINTKEPKTVIDMVNQYIIYNQYITIDNKPVPSNFFHNDNCNIKLDTIINNDGKIYPRDILNTKIKNPLDKIKYNQLITSIPRKWKKMIKNNLKDIDRSKIDNTNIPTIQIGNMKKKYLKSNQQRDLPKCN